MRFPALTFSQIYWGGGCFFFLSWTFGQYPNYGCLISLSRSVLWVESASHHTLFWCLHQRPCHQLDMFYSSPAFDQPLMTLLNLMKNLLLSWSWDERIAQDHLTPTDLRLLFHRLGFFLKCYATFTVLSFACCMCGADVLCVWHILITNIFTNEIIYLSHFKTIQRRVLDSNLALSVYFTRPTTVLQP